MLFFTFLYREVEELEFRRKVVRMSSGSRSKSKSRSKSRSGSPVNRKIRSERQTFRSAPYGRDERRGFRFFVLACCIVHLPSYPVFLAK